MNNRALRCRPAAIIMALLLALTGMIWAASSVSVYAADEYTYTVRIYSGNQGTFGGSDVNVYKGLKAGDKIIFSPSSVTLNNGSKYFAIFFYIFYFIFIT